MDHERAVALLTEYVAGHLAPEETSRLREHLEGCADCREAVTTMHLVREELSQHGPAIFDTHPSAEDLVRYALADEALSTEELAGIGGHVRACPTCRQELVMTREAHGGVESWWRRLLSPLLYPRPAGSWAVLRPVLAAALVLMIYPAYLGLVKLPELERELAGGTPLLFLESPIRGAEERIPEIRLHPRQLSQPVFIDYDLTDGGRRSLGRSIVVSLERLPGAEAIWSLESRVSEVWDDGSHTVGFFVPGELLVPGEYRLRLRETDSRELLFAGSFAVAPPREGPSQPGR